MEEEGRDEIQLASTVLKVGHHGSESSSSVDFIESVQPTYVIISSGLRRFGDQRGTAAMLPKNSAVQRIASLLEGERIYRTDHCDRDDWLAGIKKEGTEAGDDNVVLRTTGRLSDIRITYVSTQE